MKFYNMQHLQLMENINNAKISKTKNVRINDNANNNF